MGVSFQKLNLTNAYLFGAALQDEEICRFVLEIVLGRNLTRVKTHAEHSVLLSTDFKSVRLDVYATDEAEVCYNLEMQNDVNKNLAKRSRYYQAEMDVASLKPGEDYRNLKDSYVIFICTFDPFGKGNYEYVFEEYCKESGFALGDGTKRIFFNTKGTNVSKVRPELVHLLAYMQESTEKVAGKCGDDRITKIHERVKYLKRNRELEDGYMRMEELLEDRERKGVNEGRISGIFDLLSDLGDISAELHNRIATERNDEVLRGWLRLAAHAGSIEEFQSKM